MQSHDKPTASYAWFKTLKELVHQGRDVSPRGQPTLELPQHTMRLDMRYPVVMIEDRKISEKFLGAEAHWILTGSDKVVDIAPFNKKISKYSDDGEVFFGAYGPKIIGQLDFVIAKLIEDPDTRQAGLNIWRENPPATKDVPCTVSMFFNIRNERLQMHVFMRSSDIWLGVPYDIFNFSMLAHLVCARYNQENPVGEATRPMLSPGVIYLTAASRHLYLTNLEAAKKIINCNPRWPATTPTPEIYYLDPSRLIKGLDAIRHETVEAMWWRQEP